MKCSAQATPEIQRVAAGVLGGCKTFSELSATDMVEAETFLDDVCKAVVRWPMGDKVVVAAPS
jgi:hypothetical protein